MKNKKATGTHWYIWYFAVIAAVSYILYETTLGLDIATGEIPAAVVKRAEEISTVPQRMEGVMEVLHDESVADLQDYELYLDSLDTYCDAAYIISLGTQYFDTELYGGSFGESFCYVDENRLRGKFGGLFNDNYNDASLDIDLLSGSYTPNVPTYPVEIEGEKYFLNQVMASSDMVFKIKKQDGSEIGNFFIDPGFQFLFPKGYTFAGKEWCIWSANPPCTGCEDAQARYGGVIMNEPCLYYGCSESYYSKDSNGIKFPCEDNSNTPMYLCTGTCNKPDCNSDDETETDSYQYCLTHSCPAGITATDCFPSACSNYYLCQSFSECICSTGNPCMGLCLPYCGTIPNTVCRPQICGSYTDCSITTSCGCNSGFSCQGTCTTTT